MANDRSERVAAAAYRETLRRMELTHLGRRLGVSRTGSQPPTLDDLGAMGS
jgi:hypothetical protein